MRTCEEHLEVFRQAGSTEAAVKEMVRRIIKEISDSLKKPLTRLEEELQGIVSAERLNEIGKAVEAQDQKWKLCALDPGVQSAGGIPQLFYDKLQLLCPTIFIRWQTWRTPKNP